MRRYNRRRNRRCTLVNKNTEKITIYFTDVCKHYRRARWLHDFKNPISKIIALDIYGLYNIARYYLDNVIFSKIEFSLNNGLIWEEFIKITNVGKPSIQFNGVLTPLNQLYIL